MYLPLYNHVLEDNKLSVKYSTVYLDYCNKTKVTGQFAVSWFSALLVDREFDWIWTLKVKHIYKYNISILIKH